MGGSNALLTSDSLATVRLRRYHADRKAVIASALPAWESQMPSFDMSRFFCPSRVRKPILLSLLLLACCIVYAKHADARSQARLPDLAECGGNDLAMYIGKPVDALRQRNPADARFVCEKDCAMTMDVRPSRLTVIYSKRTNLVVRMSCG